MTIGADVPANTRYLFNQIEPGLHDRPSHEILARRGRALRELLRHWWTALEPEATAGVSAGMMEQTLTKISEKAVGSSGGSVSRRWARGSLNRKATSLQTDAEQAIAERFLVACERNGVLVSRGTHVFFAHPSLLELYLGLGLLTTRALPLEVRQQTRISLHPLQMPRGRAVLVLLALVDRAELDAVLRTVASENLPLATWFLYYDEAARQTHGEWLATEILDAIQWDLDEPSRQSLHASLDSLGAQALRAARRFIDERQGGLPSQASAVSFVAHHGDRTDLTRLQRLLDETTPGLWEIEQMRKTLRDAEARILDEAAQKRYAQEEDYEIAKETAAAILQIAAIVLTRTSKPSAHWNHDMKMWTSGKGAGVAAGLMKTDASSFYQQQAALRELLAQLPPVIERRKVQIAAATPWFRHSCEVAIQLLSERMADVSE
jgi:hypothetical protein